MNKLRKVSILALGAIAASLLASCGSTTPDNSSDKGNGSSASESIDAVVSSIKIVEGSISTSFTQGAKVDYSNLAIDLFNAGNAKIKTLKWVENKEAITHTEIVTSEIGAQKPFTVTYTEGKTTFEDTIEYEVVEPTYTLTSWAANDNYVYTTSYVANPKIATDEDSLEKGFMKKATFYVGNMNAVNLLPSLNGLDEDYNVVTLSKIPTGAKLSLAKDGSSVAVNDYIDNANGFLSEGLLKFKDNVTGSFSVTLSYQGLKDIVYNLEVVDAYNVSKATDLFAFYTSVDSWPYSAAITEKVREYKAELGLPNAENLVLQNDVKISRSDLPDIFIWQESETDVSAVVGSLKDWLRIFDHEFKNAGDVATVYGNLHSISINDDESDEDAFPKILTDSYVGQAQQEGKPISSHAALFYGSYGANQDPFDCKIVFKDLQATGNCGVSEETTITEGGPMFLKTEIDASFDNAIISKFYMDAMSDGPGDLNSKKIGDKYAAASLSFDSCRFSDSANAGVYIYGAGSMDIKNSQIAKSGGPLLFLNPLIEKLPSDPTQVATFSTELSTNVTIDDASFLSNFSQGQGGWFEAYEGASALAGTLQSMNNLFSPYKMSFLEQRNTVNKFNLLALNLPINGSEGLGLPSYDAGGTNVTITKGGKVLYSTLDGYLSVLSAAFAAQSASTDADKLAAYNAYANALSGTFFGNNLAFANYATEMVFTATSSDGSHESAMVNVDATSGAYYLCSSEFAIKNAFSPYGITPPSTYAPSAKFQSEGYLACTINGDASIVNPNSVVMTPLSYTGVANYGVLLGNYHKI